MISAPYLLGSFWLRVQLVPSDTCNYRCIFCHRDGDWVADSGRRLEPSLVRDVYRAALPFGCTSIKLTGGEPLLHPDFGAFLRVLQDVPVSITTNASLLSSDVQEMLAQAPIDKLFVNLPSLTPQFYRALTGQTAVSLDQVCNNILSCIGKGLRVVVNMVVCRGYNDSRQELQQMVDFCQANSVARLTLLEVTRVPGNSLTQDLWIPATDFLQAFDEPSYFVSDRPFGQCYVTRRGLPLQVLKCGQCSLHCASCRDAASLFLTSRGSIKPCLWLDKEIAIDDRGTTDAIRTALQFLSMDPSEPDVVNP